MSVSLSVMTFNLHDDQPEESPNSWDKRKDLCLSVITSYSPVILCTQQGVKSQLDYIQQGLPGYDQFGISRKGHEDPTDESCTIFYNKEKSCWRVEHFGCQSLPRSLEARHGVLKFPV